MVIGKGTLAIITGGLSTFGVLLFEQAGGGDRKGRTEPHQRVERRGEVAVFDAIDGLAIDARQLREGCLAEVVLCPESQKSVCKFVSHALHITLKRSFAWF